MGRKEHESGKIMRNLIRNFVKEWWEYNYCSPSIRDIANKFDKSTSLIYHHLLMGEKQGMFILGDKHARSIRLPEMKIIFEGEHGKE